MGDMLPPARGYLDKEVEVTGISVRLICIGILLVSF